MYDVEATVTETAPTVLKLTADWPVDWLREHGIRTMEIQRELLRARELLTANFPDISVEPYFVKFDGICEVKGADYLNSGEKEAVRIA